MGGSVCGAYQFDKYLFQRVSMDKQSVVAVCVYMMLLYLLNVLPYIYIRIVFNMLLLDLSPTFFSLSVYYISLFNLLGPQLKKRSKYYEISSPY